MASHTAETYREAAREHVALALELNDTGRYGAAHYWAGLAVECMLRAYSLRQTPVFDSRHDLSRLIHQARFYLLVPPNRAEETTAKVAVVVQQWSNDHRYRPERMVAKWLRERGFDRRIRGDRLKYSSGLIVEAAAYLVELGEMTWTRES